MADCVGVDMTQITPACARPTRLYPEGRTGTDAGYTAHLKAGESACAPCQEARRARGSQRTPGKPRTDHLKRTPEQRRAEYQRNIATRYRANLKKHGLTSEQYDALLAAQGGGCAICKGTTPYGRGRFHIDHDHACCPGQRSCGKCVRGLLCGRCNPGLGAFQDSPDLLVAAAAYLMTSREARTPDAVD
jgi:hypothetical protein